jgi:hypothetical protein
MDLRGGKQGPIAGDRPDSRLPGHMTSRILCACSAPAFRPASASSA